MVLLSSTSNGRDGVEDGWEEGSDCLEREAEVWHCLPKVGDKKMKEWDDNRGLGLEAMSCCGVTASNGQVGGEDDRGEGLDYWRGR